MQLAESTDRAGCIPPHISSQIKPVGVLQLREASGLEEEIKWNSTDQTHLLIKPAVRSKQGGGFWGLG